ncbi:uncharacterized protein LOC113513452 [Galleria mellonella]|uniref:Uncharacterized protein LOC113513452 n=1 Tax=Galleria mellonella TaxID=7137 RepID=A0A6J1WP65_GALME|nr:uncharacterized protein LOC113513452 [Galleria mellonella]
MIKMADVEWTNELVIKLVEEYSKKPELWDNTHKWYRMHTAKYEAWTDLANMFDCDIADLRKKLNSIFASHRREKAKVRCGGRSLWFLYNHLKFLPNHLDNDNNPDAVVMKSNNSRIEEDFEEHTSDDNNHDVDEDHEEIIIKEEPVVQTYVKPKSYKYTTHKPRLTKTIKRRIIREAPANSSSRIDSKILETLRLIRKSDLSRKKDECDSFGEYIADSLRKHDDRTQSMIKQAINNILFEQEMKKYSTNQYEVVITGVDENPLILGDTDSNDK